MIIVGQKYFLKRERCVYVYIYFLNLLEICAKTFTDEIMQSKMYFKITCVMGLRLWMRQDGCLLAVTEGE